MKGILTGKQLEKELKKLVTKTKKLKLTKVKAGTLHYEKLKNGDYFCNIGMVLTNEKAH